MFNPALYANFDKKFTELFGQWKKIDDSRRYVVSTTHGIIVSQYRNSILNTMVIVNKSEEDFLAYYRETGNMLNVDEDYDLVSVTGSAEKAAVEQAIAWLDLPEVQVQERPIRKESITLCNSAHPFAKHSMLAKPVPMKSKPNMFYVLVGSEVVLIDKNKDMLVLVDSIDTLKTHLKEDKPFTNEWFKLDPANKYIANDIMKMMRL